LIRTRLSSTARAFAILTLLGCTVLIASSALGAGLGGRNSYSAHSGVGHPLGECAQRASRGADNRHLRRLARRRHHRRLQHRSAHRHSRCVLRKHKAPKIPTTSPTPSPTTSPTPSPTTSPTPSPTTSPTPSPPPPSPPPPSPPPPSPNFSAVGIDAGSIQLSWPSVAGAASAQVWRGTALLDQFSWPGSGPGTYTDRNLWPATQYTYSVRIFDGSSQIAQFQGSAATLPRNGAFPRPFADSSFVNVPIGSNPELEPNSSAIVSKSLAAYAGGSNMSNSDSWGIPVAYADAQSNQYVVGCTTYWCNIPVPAFSIPSFARTSVGSDEHLAVLDAAGRELDMWDAHKTGDSWDAGARTVLPTSGSGLTCAPNETCGRANAAGFALLAGIVRPEEIAQGHIDHALVVTTPYTRAGYIACPAKGGDGKYNDPAALPEGARIQLDPSLNVGSLPISNLNKILASAMQVYGAYVVDTGGSLSIRAESNLGRGYDAWGKVGVPSTSPGLSGIPWDRMRVLKLTKCG
jgi:hypothetical protein